MSAYSTLQIDERPLGESQSPADLAGALDVSQAPGCRIGFGLLILVNAVLFVRPAEIVPGWQGLPIYECLILACLLFSLPAVLPQLRWSSLRRNPITVCVIGLLVAVVLSHLSRGNLYDARASGLEFIKIVIYYLLTVGLINTPYRCRLFLLIIAGFVLCTAMLSLLNHHGVIDIPALADLKREYDPNDDWDDPTSIVRLRAMGIFNDPNDFCLILNAATFVCLHRLLAQKGWVAKLAWALPITTYIYALVLTQSRGGFLSLLMGFVVLLFLRVRWKRALVTCAILLPAVFLVIGGRLTDINVEDANDTAQGRIQLWRDSLVEFHGAPLFGIGQGTLADTIGLVAHNSYIHSYAELGFFGGTLFVGAFFLAFAGLSGFTVREDSGDDPELCSLRLCLLPVLGAYMMGIYSLSRDYGNATYLILGLTAAFATLGAQGGLRMPEVSWRLARRLVVVSVGCVVYFECFVRVFVQ